MNESRADQEPAQSAQEILDGLHNAPVPPPKPPWWKRHRKWIIGALAVLALATASCVVYVVTRPEPEDVVSEYLDVLRSADAEAALEYTSEVEGFEKVSDDLLVKQAMATDWTYSEIVRRHTEDEGDSEPTATVDVTITAADKTSRQARFYLTEDGDSWRIFNPLAKVDLLVMPMTYAEFNGQIAKPTESKPDDDVISMGEQPDSQLVWMFPGAYKAFEKSSTMLELGAPTYVAVPSGPEPLVADEDGGEPTPQAFAPIIKPGKDIDAELDRQLADWLDECAESTAVNPEGCPFAGGNPPETVVSLEDGDDFETDKVAWKIKSYPTIEVTQGAGYLTVREVEPGEVTISGKGTSEYEPEKPAEKFTGDCDIEISSVTIWLTKPKVFGFGTAGGNNVPRFTCSLRFE